MRGFPRFRTAHELIKLTIHEAKMIGLILSTLGRLNISTKESATVGLLQLVIGHLDYVDVPVRPWGTE
jgi:hypothetical protein